jgi:hypothetical protein
MTFGVARGADAHSALDLIGLSWARAQIRCEVHLPKTSFPTGSTSQGLSPWPCHSETAPPEAIAYLAAPQASHVHVAILPVDGGLLASA